MKRIRRAQNNHQQHISILFNYNKFQVIECISFKVKEEELKLWNVIYQNKKFFLSSRETFIFDWLKSKSTFSSSKNINFNKIAQEYVFSVLMFEVDEPENSSSWSVLRWNWIFALLWTISWMFCLCRMSEMGSF